MDKQQWSTVITSKSGWFGINIKEIYAHRDLLGLFVKRDFISVYKQTVLGPLWFVIQPILSTIMFSIIFGGFGKLSTDGIPQPLFYLAGLTMWNYFAESLTKTSDTFVKNQQLFGKVYFPRLIVPLSIVISNLAKLGIQFVIFLIVWIYYLLQPGNLVEANATLVLMPLIVLILSGLSLGFGIIFSAVTTKYRDLSFLLIFGVQLLMFASSVIIPLSSIPEKVQWVFRLNPMVNLIEAFKYGFLGKGHFSWLDLGYSFVFMILLVFVGSMIFNRVQKNFMDSV